MTRAPAAIVVTLALTGALSAAFAEKAPPPRRAKPPVWSPDVLDEFFSDAREHLVGERPASELADADVAKPGAAPSASDPAPSFAWSRIVSGDTLDAEVKRIVAGLRQPLANPAAFKSGGYKQCRADFSLLAVVFAVIAEHDGDVRWKDDAARLRDALARAAMNCKTATDQTFAEAMQRRTELEDLVRGERLGGPSASELSAWSLLAERPLVMERMEALLDEEIRPHLAGEKVFSKQADAVRQKAELLAMLAEVAQRPEYDYWDDAGFQELSGDLRRATADLTRAAAEANYEAARAAAGAATQACSACHEGYRG